jgi:3-oxoacyl-[acyl-carrier protein] reductase
MQANKGGQKVAMVTGSTKGIGRAIAERLVADGYSVITNGRNEPAAVLGELFVKADTTEPRQIKSLIEKIKEKYSNVDVLVCNVGSGKQIGEIGSKARWDHYLNQNLLSSVLIIEALLEENLLQEARIIGISSIAAITHTSAPVEYSVSKSALITYFKNMAKVHAKNRTNFNIVNLGNVIFSGSTWEDKINKDEESVQRYLDAEVPANRFATLDEISDLISFMASTKCEFMTGAVINVDGGQSL